MGVKLKENIDPKRIGSKEMEDLTGTMALIANALGAGDEKKARLYAIQSVSFSVLLSMALMVIGLFAAPFLFWVLGASDTYLAISLSYINVIFYGFVFISLQKIKETFPCISFIDSDPSFAPTPRELCQAPIFIMLLKN